MKIREKKFTPDFRKMVVVNYTYTRVRFISSGKIWLIRNYNPSNNQHWGNIERNGEPFGATRWLRSGEFELI